METTEPPPFAGFIDPAEAFPDVEDGYAYAFLEPPYRLRGTVKEIADCFHAMERLFFGRFDPNGRIWRWNDACSNYFDTGREWWGTYFYTYALEDSDVILGIAASATD